MARKRALTVAAIYIPALVAVAGGFSQSANAALIAYYPLNGTTNNLADPTNNGVVHGTTQYTTDQNGNANGAFAFDGATYISASASSFPTTDRTVFLWFNAETVATKPVFLGYGGGSCGTSFFVGLNASGGGDYYVTSHCGVNNLLYSYPSDPSGNWHSFAVTTDASGTNLYVDGSLVASNANFISNTAVAGTDLAIGVDVSPGGSHPIRMAMSAISWARWMTFASMTQRFQRPKLRHSPSEIPCRNPRQCSSLCPVFWA